MPSSHVDALLDALTAGDDDRAEAAAIALGRLGEAALPDLRARLSNSDADQRWWMTRAIGAIESEHAVDALIEQCADPDPEVRACAIYALGARGERARAAVAVLIRQLADPSAYVGRLAADALARIGSAATAPLVEVLRSGSPAARGQAARALAQIGDPSSIPALIAALDDDSPLVEYYADMALHKLGVGTVLLRA